MSTLTAAPKPTFGHALHTEWIKLRSLRSTWYTLAGLFVVALGITALNMGSIGSDYDVADKASWDPANLSLTAYIVAQLIIGVLAILVVTSEYATGLMQTSLTATPRRNRLLAAKVVLAAGVALVVGQVLMFACFFFGQALLVGQDVPYATLGDPGVFGAVAGGGVYLAAIALLSIGLGTMMRATAGALATLVGIVFLVPALAGLLPSWLHSITEFWPSMGPAAVFETVPNADYPHPWLNLLGLFVASGTVLACAFVVFRRRDV